jgi:hypothetical protein
MAEGKGLRVDLPVHLSYENGKIPKSEQLALFFLFG